MKLKDIGIGMQLRIGLGGILLLVSLLGAMAWFQADILWQVTRDLYKHPHTVRKAIGEIRADVLSMQGGMKDLVLADNDPERETVIRGVDLDEADAMRQFDVLYDRYLGPRHDIDAAYNEFIQWKTIRAETLRLLNSGNVAEAMSRIKPGGPGSSHVKTLKDHIQEISDFAAKKSDQFYQFSRKEKEVLQLRLGVLIGIILLTSMGLSYLLLRGIRTPLKDLISAAEQYRNGNHDTRSRYVSANEFGLLAAAFNDLAQTVQLESQSKEHAVQMADAMLREEAPRPFCRELLKALLQHTGSQLGAVYLLNEAGTDFEHFESIGMAAPGRASFSAAAREGEFGAALATHRIQQITDIPDDTRLAFTAVAGSFIPRDILTIPVLSGQDVVAVISLAGVRGYSSQALRLTYDVQQMISARLNSVLAFDRIRAVSEKLEHQNRELEAQQHELMVQSDELSEQNIELELQKKQLDETNRLKNAFLSNMSHELRTPLNSVIALSGVLSRRLRGAVPDEEYGYLEVIERNGRNLLSLINDILDLSRIEAGRHEIMINRFSVTELVDDIVTTIAPQAREKGIALVNDATADLPTIRSDFAKCRHVLQNIVANAVKFTEAGSVRISAVQADDAVQIAVADTGISIPADQLACIFDEFRQADESTARKYGGSGLGLSIARKYATLLHGGIAVESTPGKGSIFTFRLPFSFDAPGMQAADDPSGFPAVEPPQTGTADCRGKCILLVEDSEPAVIQMRDILSECGCRVLVARNGKEALERIENTLPDAMILDLMMPEVDGFEVLKRIREAEKTSRLPVLILTAKHVTAEELHFLKGNHIHQLIQKGEINKAGLLSAIGKMVFPQAENRLPQPPCPAPASARNPDFPESGKPVVLVVEDNPDNMKTVKALLQDTCTIIAAADGRQGVDQAMAHVPDLILMDISLPVMDGFKAFDAIRSLDALRHIPIVALTAGAMKGNRETILAHGFDGFLPKPIDQSLLETTLHEKLSPITRAGARKQGFHLKLSRQDKGATNENIGH